MSAISVSPDSTIFSSPKDGKSSKEPSIEKKERKKTKRVQIELAENAMDRLDFLKNYLEAGSVSEVVRNALRLYEDMVKEKLKGKDFLVQDPSGVISPYKAFIEP